jgi:hypothetical protein
MRQRAANTFQICLETLHPDFQHLTDAMDTLWSSAVYETSTPSLIRCTKYGQRATDYVTLITERNMNSQRGSLARATLNVILIWLLWKGLMLLLFLLSVSLIVDIAVSTVVSEDDGYEGATMRAVRVIELHLIRLIMTILTEIWSNVKATLMACTWSRTVQNVFHSASRLEVRMSVLEARQSQSIRRHEILA